MINTTSDLAMHILKGFFAPGMDQFMSPLNNGKGAKLSHDYDARSIAIWEDGRDKHWFVNTRVNGKIRTAEPMTVTSLNNAKDWLLS